ncbi:MAG: TatD family hydrolase [Amphritea sp.]
MKLIDTHSHLDFPAFKDEIDAVLARARAQGVAQFVVPGVNGDNWSAVLSLCERKQGLYPALGIHPCFLSGEHREDLQRLDSLLESKCEIVAVGEIGLDLFMPEADLDQQLSVLKRQLEIAHSHNKPVLLHVRKAHDQMLKQLRHYRLPRAGIVHAFSGSEQQALEYLKLGFKLGVGGSVTYERARKLRRLVVNLPLESFVLETDSPDMPLCGYQGQVNYPERVAIVLQQLAVLRQESINKLAEVTTATAVQLLSL